MKEQSFVDDFVADRLVFVRKRRGLTIAALSIMSNVSTKSLSDYENNKKSPSLVTLQKLALVLGVPVEYFSRPLSNDISTEAVSFRAPSKMSARARGMALSLASHAVELREWIDSNYQTPSVDVPILHDFEGIYSADIAAAVVRANWGLGDAPLGNVIHLLEMHGISVFSSRVGNEEFDAFSFREDERLFILLNTSKSAERGRFDAIHELGHLVLHSEVERPGGIEEEREANAFASAFLMPEADIRANIPLNPNMNVIIKKKRRWGVAATALAYRLHNLGLLSDWLYQTICVNLSRRGYRSGEPNGMDRESSRLLNQVLSDVRQTRGRFETLCRDLAVSPRDVNDLMFGLATIGFIGSAQKTDLEKPNLKLV